MHNQIGNEISFLKCADSSIVHHTPFPRTPVFLPFSTHHPSQCWAEVIHSLAKEFIFSYYMLSFLIRLSAVHSPMTCWKMIWWKNYFPFLIFIFLIFYFAQIFLIFPTVSHISISVLHVCTSIRANWIFA